MTSGEQATNSKLVSEMEEVYLQTGRIAESFEQTLHQNLSPSIQITSLVYNCDLCMPTHPPFDNHQTKRPN